ncbi:hypothetical protein [Tepidibacillus sp. LV47]|uniref:hypothetical protein n=1 Tax=Tepidibacillus sp. LV47 TaxID=3398228 RepID=UPI003AAD28EB
MDQSKNDGVKLENNILKRTRKFSDVGTVESQRDNLVPEEFPEGPYGSPINHSLTKDTPYLESQRATSAFTYENKQFHEGIKRQDPNAHPTHDNPDENIEK